MDWMKEFHGPNAGYILELYERFLKDPGSVDPSARAFFESWRPDSAETAVATMPSAAAVDKIVATVVLATAIREHGHLAAKLDPLGRERPGDPALELSTYELTENDLLQLPANLIRGPLSQNCANAREAIEALRRVYSSTTGYDYDHVHSPEERDWLRQAAESGRFRSNNPAEAKELLELLTKVEVFERFLHRIFPGKTRFSLEGLDMMVPILDEVLGASAEFGMTHILIGMAHRGRLNVLAHVLNKPYVQLLAEFKDPVRKTIFEDDLGWMGDVKYHAGARRSLREGATANLIVSMAPNPSHLEAVNPVVEGMARAAGTHVDHRGAPKFNHGVTLPILIHGDAAFPGQGIVAETLNLSRIPGYRTGGTIHIIANNQLGFTTLPEAGRSTLYASDMAKGFEVPVVHVNADDPEACMEAARLAFAYRSKYQKDFLIDLIGYRRYGHNEGDEPAFTQPLMYQLIEKHPGVREIWAKKLAERKIYDVAAAEDLVRKGMDELQQTLEALKAEEALVEPLPSPPPPGAAKRVKTAVPLERLRKLHESLLELPEGLHLHRKIERAMQRKRKTLDDPDESSIDWAAAEDLAFASILEEAIAIRLTGQDAERGTFSQRHATFHDVENGSIFTPLQALPQAKAAFEIRNSPLSEAAAVGFEYGYNVQEPGRLVLWEAQYGDFINSAQVIIDEFVVSARSKWGLTPSLVLLLPHGYEGQGPDHSTGRLERFLEVAADTNIRVANCTTAAQYFHLLRRQALLLKTDPLPLVVMTPKSLLRHPMTVSSARDLAKGSWLPVIDDAQAREQADSMKRILLCSGKMYVDLMTSDLRKENLPIAIIRLEQLYPFPKEQLEQVLEAYMQIEEVVWIQEEPENMGAWMFLRPLLQDLLRGRCALGYIGRNRKASPAEGSAARHTLRQKQLIEKAFQIESRVAVKV
ncbi:2-oxoglutarate dehydrogenase E1 component [bacterium]|nr:2-oxoglutarate dehydrogenase E1 component [bacterium]